MNIMKINLEFGCIRIKKIWVESMYDFCNDSQHMLCFSLVFHVFTCLREMLHKKSAGVHLNLRFFKRYSIDPCVYTYHPQRDEHIYLHPHSLLLDSLRKTLLRKCNCSNPCNCLNTVFFSDQNSTP